MESLVASENLNGPTIVEEKTPRRVKFPGPRNPMVSPLLTDLNQFTMAYAYWKAGKHQDRAVFDLYFRKNPFGGEYTVFGGLEECIRFASNFKLKEEEIFFLRSVIPGCEDGFFDYLRNVDCSDVEVHAISEGSVAVRVEGPVAVVQLLETRFLNLVNYASLVTTNAARHRFVAGKSKALLEFGLRRSQVAAGRLFGIPLRGTYSHAFVSSFMSLNEIVDKALCNYDSSSTCEDFVGLVQSWLNKVQGFPDPLFCRYPAGPALGCRAASGGLAPPRGSFRAGRTCRAGSGESAGYPTGPALGCRAASGGLAPPRGSFHAGRTRRAGSEESAGSNFSCIAQKSWLCKCVTDLKKLD